MIWSFLTTLLPYVLTGLQERIIFRNKEIHKGSSYFFKEEDGAEILTYKVHYKLAIKEPL
jgi:hypothetical protein